MCGDYYIGGREFDTLSDLIGYYTSYSDLLKGERLLHPVSPPEVGLSRMIEHTGACSARYNAHSICRYFITAHATCITMY